MRIVFDCQQLAEQMTGVGYYTARVLRGLLDLKSSHEFGLLCHAGNAELVKRLANDSPQASLIVLTKPVSLNYQVQQDMLSQLLPEYKADLYFSPCFLSVSPNICRSISVVHDATFVLHPEFHPNGGAEYLHRLVGDTCRNAERIITMSENSRRDISRFYHYSKEKIDVVPLAPDAEFSEEITAESKQKTLQRLNITQEYILAVNMGSPKKNARTLFQAYAGLQEDLKSRYRLVVAGEWNPQTLDLARLAEEYGIADQVTLTGWISRQELCCLYAGASLFCFPSWHEGFGLPVIEAMAAGVPVISSNAASLPEVAADAAVLVAPKDIPGWTREIERLLDSSDTRSELAAKGKARSSTFSWQKTAQHTMQIIDGLGSTTISPERNEASEISLVALLGKEAEHVVPFIENLEPHVSEIVFVSDSPQPEARRALDDYLDQQSDNKLRDKIKLVARQLNHDFASQRNFGHDHCTHAWVLHADMDERFEPDLLRALPDLIQQLSRSGKSVCGFPRLNYLNDVLVNDVPRELWSEDWLQQNKQANEKADDTAPAVQNQDIQFRLLRRPVRWRNKVHETPEPVASSPAQVAIWTHGAIRHAKSLSRQNRQDHFYESIVPGGSLCNKNVPDRKRDGLRLLMLASEYPPAKGFGLARYASGLAQALAECGHEMHVLTLNYESGVRSVQRDGVFVHNMSDNLSVKHYEWVGNTVLNNTRALAKGQEIAEEHGKFDAIISHDWLLGHAAKSLKEVLGVPWHLIMHDTEMGKRGGQLTPGQVYIAEMEAWCIKQAEQVLVPGNFLRNEITRLFKLPQDDITVIGCGIDLERFQSSTNIADFRRLFATDDELLLVYAGRLSPMKGVEDLLQAFGQLLERQLPVRLAIAGDGVLLGPLCQQCRERGWADRVFFTGTLGDKVIGALYRAADLVIMPSRYEPFGMVALEAAGLGARVLASDVGGLSGIIKTSGGLVQGIQPNKPDLLAQTIKHELEQRDPWCEKREEAKKWVTDHYSWKSVAQRMAAALLALKSADAMPQAR